MKKLIHDPALRRMLALVDKRMKCVQERVVILRSLEVPKVEYCTMGFGLSHAAREHDIYTLLTVPLSRARSTPQEFESQVCWNTYPK